MFLYIVGRYMCVHVYQISIQSMFLRHILQPPCPKPMKCMNITRPDMCAKFHDLRPWLCTQ